MRHTKAVVVFIFFFTVDVIIEESVKKKNKLHGHSAYNIAKFENHYQSIRTSRKNTENAKKKKNEERDLKLMKCKREE